MRDLPTSRRWFMRAVLYGVALALPIGGILTAPWPGAVGVLLGGALVVAMAFEREIDRVAPTHMGCSFCEAPGAVFARAHADIDGQDTIVDPRMLVSGHAVICERCVYLATTLLAPADASVSTKNPFAAPSKPLGQPGPALGQPSPPQGAQSGTPTD